MENMAITPVENPERAFMNFQDGLSRALRVSKDELVQRVARDDAARTGFSADMRSAGGRLSGHNFGEQKAKCDTLHRRG